MEKKNIAEQLDKFIGKKIFFQAFENYTQMKTGRPNQITEIYSQANSNLNILEIDECFFANLRFKQIQALAKGRAILCEALDFVNSDNQFVKFPNHHYVIQIKQENK